MIRMLAPGDGDIFRRIRLESLRCEPGSFASEYDDWAGLSDLEWEGRAIAHPVFVDFDGGEPVGLMGLVRHEAAKLRHRALLVMVYLRAAHRGKARAEALLGAVIEHARLGGVRQIELEVSAENPAALRFYARMGFEKIGTIPGAARRSECFVDDHVLMRRI